MTTLTLRGLTWEHERGFGSMAAAAREYEARTGVRVEWQVRSLQSFADTPLQDIAGDVDLLVIDHPHVPLAAELGVLAVLGDTSADPRLVELADASLGASHSTYRHQEQQLALAVDAAAQVSAHRPDLLEEVPTTWDEVLGLARRGRVLWPAKPIDAYSSLLTLAANNGTPAFSEPGLFLAADHLHPVLQLMHELASLVPPQCLSASPIDVAEMLCGDGRWAFSPLTFGYTNYSRAGYRSHRLAFTDIPRGRLGVEGSLLGGAGIAVSASSRYVREASDFAFWVASGDVQRGVYFDGGGQPAHVDAWDDAGLDTALLGFFSGTRGTLEGGTVRPRLASYASFQETAAPWVTKALRGDLRDGDLVERLNDAAALMHAQEGGRW